MISDGTFFVLEDGPVSCWLWRLESQIDPAKIRGFFVHPSWARQGLGTRILLACEENRPSSEVQTVRTRLDPTRCPFVSQSRLH